MNEVRAPALTFVPRGRQGQPHLVAQSLVEAGAVLTHAVASVGGNAMTTAGNAMKSGWRRDRSGNAVQCTGLERVCKDDLQGTTNDRGRQRWPRQG